MNEPHKRIHRKLRKHAPESVRKARKIFSFKYPKLFLLVLLIIVAYLLFSRPFIVGFMESFNDLGAIGVFISGILTALGFTAPFGVGLLINLNPEGVVVSALIAGIGATAADLFIFKTIKLSFMDEFMQLKRTKVIREIRKIASTNKYILIRHYLLYIFAGIVIATPLPDELGVSMLAGLTTIKPLTLTITSFILHTSAIFCILYFL
jgi:hypothetical protein